MTITDLNPPSEEIINDFTSLRVKNVGSTEVVFQWGQQVFGVKAGTEAYVLANAVFNMLGDPRSNDIPKPNIAARSEERKRVEARWGLDLIDLNQRQSNFDNQPLIEVYTTSGERMYTVLEDPLGLKARKVSITQAGHEMLMERIIQLEHELTNLHRMVPKPEQLDIELPPEVPLFPDDLIEPPTLDVPEDDD